MATDGLSLGQRGVHLGASWHWSYQAKGKLLASDRSHHLCSPPATKTLPCKPYTMGEGKKFFILAFPTPTWHLDASVSPLINFLNIFLHGEMCE